MAKNQQERILLGLKIRQFRQEKGWSFDDLGRNSGISVSYLNEIEKGKKYPQPENVKKIAEALGVAPDFLTSPVLTKQYAPIGDLLHSRFLNELPFDLFGIDLQQVIEIIARAPDRVNAFISAMLEIARNYSLQNENFFFAALRAYQELHMNYFEDIEATADAFVRKNGIPENGGVPANMLSELLQTRFDYKIDETGLDKHPELSELRSVFSPKKKRLLLNSRLNERQRAFQLAKELGFNVLGLQQRPLASNLLRVNSFEEVLNNYMAAYFAVAILVNRQAFTLDLKAMFSQSKWAPDFLLNMMQKYQASPEVLFQRFNVLSVEFDLHKVFFLRFIHDLERDGFDIDKELHLNRRHEPHASGLNEHYCRRWLSISLLRDLQHAPDAAANPGKMIAGAQRASFLNSGEEYLCMAVAKQAFPTTGRNVSVTIGIQLDETAKKVIRFHNDPAIARQTVNVTCQRCALSPCQERAAPPVALQRREERRKMAEALKKITG